MSDVKSQSAGGQNPMGEPHVEQSPAFVSEELTKFLGSIAHGEDSKEIYNRICIAISSLTKASEISLYLKVSETDSQATQICQLGNGREDLPTVTEDSYKAFDESRYTVFPITAAEGWIGCIILSRLLAIPEQQIAPYLQCCAIAYERQKSVSELQHLHERLQLLNSLNELLIHNTDLERLTKSLTREAAFSFAADISLLFITNPLQNTLELTGTYGCNPDQIPATISPREGLVGQVMSTGGYLSVKDLRQQTEHKVRYLEKSGIISLHACCLEIQGKTLGTILIGFRRKREYCQQEMARFEELCRGAAVAIANNLAQSQLKSYTERLEELVEQRTAELEVESEKAQQANDAKSHFLANMTHELRTPITAILGYSSIMSDGVLGDITAQQAEGLSAIMRSSDHLKSLIDDVLNLARIEAGKEEVAIVPLSLRDQITHVQQLMKQAAVEKRIQFPNTKLSEETAILEFLCDRKHFQQIIMNLVSNAIKYTPADGSVWIEARKMEDKIEIAVCDTGVGLSDTEKSEIFERFNRTGNPYSQQQVGTGLGLALTKNLVELNRGKIRAEDNPGGGSRFILTYPIVHEQSPEIAGVLTELNESDKITKLDGLSILVVDDNEDTRDILRTILIAAGATVQVTSSVPDARASLQHFHPDVLLTEMAMPGESGIDLIHFVRNGTSGLDHIPIVVLSACAFDSDQLTALSAGANIFYPKPFRPSEVLQGIRELTLHHAMMDE